MGNWIAVGVATGDEPQIAVSELLAEHTMKALGPFDTADDAREAVNRLGLGESIAWTVIPLRRP